MHSNRAQHIIELAREKVAMLSVPSSPVDNTPSYGQTSSMDQYPEAPNVAAAQQAQQPQRRTAEQQPGQIAHQFPAPVSLGKTLVNAGKTNNVK